MEERPELSLGFGHGLWALISSAACLPPKAETSQFERASSTFVKTMERNIAYRGS